MPASHARSTKRHMSERQIVLHPGVRDICRQVADAVVEIGLCDRLADRVALAAAQLKRL